MQDLLNLTSFQYWNFTERQHSFQDVQIMIPPTWNFSSCLPERSLKTGRLAELDILLVESQPYTDDLPWSLQVPRPDHLFDWIWGTLFFRILAAGTGERG